MAMAMVVVVRVMVVFFVLQKMATSILFTDLHGVFTLPCGGDELISFLGSCLWKNEI